ncbi:hypothetical protein GCM10010187_59790 [Actinomadura coerulea]|nr:hypothetical protein GCM10010187_59790 [Actinomadura coerulea]
MRIVIVSGLPATRISSGSSAASVSGRRTGDPDALSRSTGLRTVIRPMTVDGTPGTGPKRSPGRGVRRTG